MPATKPDWFTQRSHQSNRMTARVTRVSRLLGLKRKKRKTTQAVKTLPTSIKEKKIPRAEAPCIPFTKRKKTNKSVGIRR
eukprot:981017-Pelagomonas_calceolata.AAC.1